MNFRRIIVGPLQTNCYLLWIESNATLVIDPGDEGNRIEAFIKESGTRPIAVILTHGHYDHIRAANQIAEKYEIPILIHPDEIEMAKNPNLNFSAFSKEPVSVETKPLTQEFFDAHKFPFKILHLPGHTPGGIGLVGDEYFISGDTVFAGGNCGRTDLPGGDSNTLIESIEKVLQIPDELVLLAGHGGRSIVGREKPLWRRLINMLRQ